VSRRQQLESSSRAGARWYQAGDNRVVARVLDGLKVVLDTRDFSLTPHLALEGHWESWITVWVLDQIFSGAHVLNIGANCGYYALMFAKLGADKVVAVEPQAHLAANLRLSASLNGFEKTIVVEECVAGHTAGSVKMKLYDDFSGSAHVVGHSDADGPYRTSIEDAVPCQPAHQLLPTATCAFIDAEGYEPLIWQGLQPLLDRKQLHWIALEWAPVRYTDPGAFLRSLKEYGTLAVINANGEEMQVRDSQLLGGGDWDTLLVRRR
jgi:FkbM family methyltransferase